MGIVFKNNAKTTLASGITDTATSATVADGSVFPTLGAGEYFFCTFDTGTQNEIVKVTARSGNTLTIVRAQDNTTAKSFLSGHAAELRVTAGVLENIQENIAAKSANQTIYSTTTASSATSYDIGIDPGVEANASVFLDGVYQHHDTFSFSGSTLTFDAAPVDGTALEVIVDNLINLQSSNLSVDTFTAADVGGSPQTDFTLSDVPGAETNLIVFVDGVFQNQDSYTFSNNTLTMTDGVIADRVVTVYIINPVNIGTPSDGTITSAKLSGDITFPGDITVTGDVAFDSPTFVVDNANSRVGIGTAAPSTLLDIVGDVKMSADLTVDTDSLHVDSANNRVGIGTSSPDGKLHVESSSSGATAGAGGDELVLESSATTGLSILSGTANDGNILFGDSGNSAIGYMQYKHSVNALAFGTNGSEVARFDSSGNFGIGTGAPDANLQIRGSGDRSLAITSGTAGAAILNFGDTTSGDFDIGSIIYDNANNSMQFKVNNSERLRIDSSGRVSIGTTSTNAPLRVKVATNANFTVQNTSSTVQLQAINDAGNAFTTLDIAGNPIKFSANGSETLRIDSDGDINIGIQQDIDVGNSSHTGHYFSKAGAAIHYRAGNTALYVGRQTNDGELIQLRQGGSVVGSIGTQNWGIGTSSPNYILNTNYNANATFTNAASDFTQMWQNSGTNALGVALSDDLVARLVTNNSYEFAIGSSTTEQLRIDGGGRVGIGKDNPSEKLEVAGNIFINTSGNPNLTVKTSGAGNNPFIRIQADTNYWDLQTLFSNADDELDFRYNGSSKMIIDSSGNVGIGLTPASTNKLEVFGNIKVNASNDNGFLLGGNCAILRQDSTEMGFETNGSERMRITSGGEVRIGSETSSGSVISGTAIGAEFSNAGLLHIRNTAGNSMKLTSNRTDGAGLVAYFERENSDGTILQFAQGGAVEGNISVSGATVSYNGFSGTHESSGIPTDTAVGTVVSTIDELDTYTTGSKTGETRADHAKIKVSDVEGDARVYGVLSKFDENDKPVVASVGIGSVKVTGACNGGDLLESNGDGTAKVQSDDIIRSKTIGKVTIGNSDTGVKLVSCVLYCG